MVADIKVKEASMFGGLQSYGYLFNSIQKKYFGRIGSTLVQMELVQKHDRLSTRFVENASRSRNLSVAKPNQLSCANTKLELRVL